MNRSDVAWMLRFLGVACSILICSTSIDVAPENTDTITITVVVIGFICAAKNSRHRRDLSVDVNVKLPSTRVGNKNVSVEGRDREVC